MDKTKIINKTIKDVVGPVRFRKYLLEHENDETFGNDYDFLLKNREGKFKYAGYVQWDKTDLIEIEGEELNFFNRVGSLHSLFEDFYFYHEMERMVDDYIIDLLIKRIKNGQIKNVPIPRRRL